jgi:hypothetical protein
MPSKPVLRGALTDGKEWIFLILTQTLNHEGQPDGARYQHSLPFVLELQLKGQIGPLWHDVVAGILLYWVSAMSLYLIALFNNKTD